MNSFNVYGQTETKIGGHTPVWLGTVKPIPVGATIESIRAKTLYPSGTPVKYDADDKRVNPIPSSLEEVNAYLYNDVVNDTDNAINDVTCAVVLHHPEGLLIERAYPEITEEQIAQLQAKIPGVLLVRG